MQNRHVCEVTRNYTMWAQTAKNTFKTFPLWKHKTFCALTYNNNTPFVGPKQTLSFTHSAFSYW